MNCDVCGGTKDQGGSIVKCHICDVNYHLSCLNVPYDMRGRLVCAPCATAMNVQENENRTRTQPSSKRSRSDLDGEYSPDKDTSEVDHSFNAFGSPVPGASKLSGAHLQKVAAAAATTVPSEDAFFKSPTWTAVNASPSKKRALNPAASPKLHSSKTLSPIIAALIPSSQHALSVTQEQKEGTLLLVSRRDSSKVWRSVRMSNIHDVETLFEVCGTRFPGEFGNNEPSRLLLELPAWVGAKGWMEIARGNEGDFEELVRMIIVQWNMGRTEVYLPLTALREGEDI